MMIRLIIVTAVSTVSTKCKQSRALFRLSEKNTTCIRETIAPLSTSAPLENTHATKYTRTGEAAEHKEAGEFIVARALSQSLKSSPNVHKMARSPVCILTVVLLIALGFPPIAHKLPFYPRSLEQGVIAYYESRDAGDYSAVSVASRVLGILPTVTNRGGHFQKLLQKKASAGAMYFEGWYYKAVSADLKHTFVAIPGVFFGAKSDDSHAFIMTIIADANAGTPDVAFERFNLADVSLKNLPNDDYEVKIKGNVFSMNQVVLDIEGRVKGSLKLTNVTELPATPMNPNIMGFFSYIDATVGMQCVHKVVAIDAQLQGELNYKQQDNNVDFTKGRIYVEGDYGSEFPSKYVWVASNHFKDNPGSSIMLSIANIPFPNNDVTLLEFTGFLGFFYDAKKGKVYRFGTYTGATATVEGFEDNALRDKSSAKLTIEDAQYILSVEAKGVRSDAAVLWGPKLVDGKFAMHRYVHEMLNGVIDVTLVDRKDYSVLFQGTGTNAGLEIEF